MRKLTQIMPDPQCLDAIWAIDENGELWFGAVEITDDDRRMIEWSPVNRPKDGASFSKPQESFFDKWERKAREIIEADREADAVATPGEDVTDGASSEAEGSPDHGEQDGEGSDPDTGASAGALE